MVFRPQVVQSKPPSWVARLLLPFAYAAIAYVCVSNPGFQWTWPMLVCLLGYWILRQHIGLFSRHHLVQALGGIAFIQGTTDVLRAYVLPFFQATDFTRSLPWHMLSQWLGLIGIALVLAVVVMGSVNALLGRGFYIPWVSESLGLE
ncbi:MAG: hypothetical protein ACKO37_00950 [Vampirovibrionales bacterium]